MNCFRDKRQSFKIYEDTASRSGASPQNRKSQGENKITCKNAISEKRNAKKYLIFNIMINITLPFPRIKGFSQR